MPDPWTAAWEEAEATAPPGVVVYCTLELQHPGIVDISNTVIPIRCVTDVTDDMDFGIEAGALYNGGGTGAFQAIPFFADRPVFAEGQTPACNVTIDGVAREITPHLEAAISIKADLVAIYREYRSDDLTEPCYGPVEFVMRKVTVTGATVTGQAQLDDLANRKFPYKVYSINEFPGLLPS